MIQSDTCALCGQVAILQDSHLLPQWAYKRLRDPADPAPIQIANGIAVMTNSQARKHLLCTACEARFSIAEDYMARITAPPTATSPLRQNITRLSTPRGVMLELGAAIDPHRLAYFAASVIWRSHAMRAGCQLGSYEPGFRNFLLGVAPFPDHAALAFGVLEATPNYRRPENWMTMPTSHHQGKVWIHGFMLAGVMFRCVVGKEIPSAMRLVSIAHPNSKYYGTLQAADSYSDFLGALELLNTATPKGKLASP